MPISTNLIIVIIYVCIYVHFIFSIYEIINNIIIAAIFIIIVIFIITVRDDMIYMNMLLFILLSISTCKIRFLLVLRL